MTKPFTLLLYIICILFIALYTMLSWHSRLATDDYSSIWQVYNYGVIKETYTQYMWWSGRIAATFLTDTIYQLLDVNQTYYFFYPLLSGLLLITGVYKGTAVISTHFNISINSSQKKLTALLFTTLLFFMTIDFGETWFWYNSISHYLGSVIASIWGIAFLFDKQKQVLSTVTAIFCFIYIGSASEVYSVVFGLFFLWLLYHRFKQSNYGLRNFFSNKENKKAILVAAFFLVSFIITVIAPGNYVRADFFPKPNLITTIRLSIYMLGKLFFWFLPQKIFYIIAFAGPFMIIGKQFNKGNSLSLKEYFKNIRIPSLLLLATCFIVFGLIAFIMSQSGEYRVWFILSFLFTIYFSGISFYAGYSGLLSDKNAQRLKVISILSGLSIMIITITNQYTITKKYSEAHDERVAFLIQTNEHIQKDTIIVLPLLPPSGMLHSAEITTDINSFLNEELKQGYRLKFHVISEKKLQ